MLFEGTEKYFWILFFILVLIYITKKVSLFFIFKKARMKPMAAFIPIKYRLDLASALSVKKSVALMAYIPFYGIKFRLILIEALLKAFNLSEKDAISFILFPMYKYPELAFRNVKFIQNDYSLTEGFIESQQILFGENGNSGGAMQNVNPSAMTPETTFNNSDVQPNFNDSIFNESNVTVGTSIPTNVSYNQNMVPVNKQNASNDSVFTNQTLVPDEKHETYVEVKPEEKKVEQAPVIHPLETGRPKVCPKCGATLSPNSTTCFMCGNRLI